MSTAAPFARFVTDYPGLIDVVGERTEQMEIARLELDRIAGLSSGHSGKLFSKAPRKNLGIISLGPVLQTLGLVLCVLEDPAARDKTLAPREKFDASNRRLDNKCNPPRKSAPQIESPAGARVEAAAPRRAEPVSRAHLRVVQVRPKARSKNCGSNDQFSLSRATP